MTRIYLDWNIITNLCNPENIAENTMRDKFIFLKDYFKNSNEIIIPYSNAHLKDLQKSFVKGERKRVEERLFYISELTKNVCLTQYWNEDKALWHIRTPNDFFESILEDDSDSLLSWDGLMESLREFGIDKLFDIYKLQPHGINFNELDKFPAFANLFPNARIEDSMYAVIQDVFFIFSQIKSNPTVYKELRKIFKDGLNIDPNISNFENTIEQLDNYLPKTMLNKSFTELYELNNKGQSKNQHYDKLTSIYMQLDFVGYNSDKLTNKNQYDNLFNDALHCFYGAHCDYFITNDIKSLKKSFAVFENQNIETKVYNTNQFLELIK